MAAIASASAALAGRIMGRTSSGRQRYAGPWPFANSIGGYLASKSSIHSPAMDLDRLSTFDKVVREGSFSRAAVALGIGQPAVSSRIQALEEDLGAILLVRGRRVTLTPTGESFLPY